MNECAQWQNTVRLHPSTICHRIEEAIAASINVGGLTSHLNVVRVLPIYRLGMSSSQFTRSNNLDE